MTDKPLILVVDDNIINRQYFSMSLKKSGFDVIAVESGQLAIEQAAVKKFDVILMDIRMPQMDGYECTRRIRNIALQNTTPIYATSAEELFKEYSGLFTGFLLKPISRKQLEDTVKQHIHNCVVFNQKNALKFAYNDNTIVMTLAKLFIKEFPSQVQTLRELTITEQSQNCEDLVHKMKGSCKACGAQQIENLLNEFSDLCSEKKFCQMPEQLNKLENALDFYKNSIKPC